MLSIVDQGERADRLYAEATAVTGEERLARLDAVIALDGQGASPETVADAWYARCHALSEDLGRHEDAVAAAREALARLDGRAPERAIAWLMNSLASDLSTLGSDAEALAAYDALLARCQDAVAEDLGDLVDRALDAKAYVLARGGHHDEALEVVEVLLARGVQGRRGVVALHRRGAALAALGRGEEAIATLREALARFGTADGDPAVAAALADVRAILARELIRAGRYDEAMIALDAVLAAPGEDADAISAALIQQGLLLVQAGRLEEGLEAYARLLDVLDGTMDLGLRVRRVAALWNTTEALVHLDRLDEAQEAHERLVAEVEDDAAAIFAAMAAELGGRDDPEARINRAGMALKHATVELSLGREEEAARLLAALIERHADDELPDVRRLVGTARELIEEDDVL